jgi:hypothetical protein
MYRKSLGTIRPSAMTAFGGTTVLLGTGVASGVVLQAEIDNTKARMRPINKYRLLYVFIVFSPN